jgi:hypothetical protein
MGSSLSLLADDLGIRTERNVRMAALFGSRARGDERATWPSSLRPPDIHASPRPPLTLVLRSGEQICSVALLAHM